MIKKIVTLLFITILLLSCAKDKKGFATISGKITNHLGNNGKISGKGYEKEIKINKDGSFNDTIQIFDEGQFFSFTDGNEFTTVFLKNGDSINLTTDTKLFDEKMTFTGNAAVNNNYIAQKSLLGEKLFSENIYDLDQKEFDAEADKIITKFKNFLNKTKGLDDTLVSQEKESIASLKGQLEQQYKMTKQREKAFAHFIGKPSPEFNNYENNDGSKTSLKDLKGKYVYIDVWATWCRPCLGELPALKELEKEYQDKNITFVSISVDNGRAYKDNDPKLAHEGWKKMIAEKELKGIQLLADKNSESSFIQEYEIKGIPRFILIDKDGKVINANAPRPSSTKIKEIFNNLK